MGYELSHYDDRDLAFAAGDGDDFLENADGSGYTGMHEGLFYADGYPANGELGGVFFADGVPARPIAAVAIPRKRNPQPQPRPMQRKDNKRRAITIKNTHADARSFYLFHSLENIQGTISSKVFAAIDDTGTDTSLSVTYFDEVVEQFLSNFRKGGVVADVDYLKFSSNKTTVDLSPFVILAESNPDGQVNWVQDVIVHNAGYASEHALRSHILTLELAKHGQSFQLGKKASRVKFTVPGNSELTIFFEMGKVMDIGRAFNNQ